ncbi:MAG: hypothetical protein EAZ08_10640 [Cytophagales bacterium]|nr:MAG: hypothetical protein EAZ08_10640 [Cytophagales bacterium]
MKKNMYCLLVGLLMLTGTAQAQSLGALKGKATDALKKSATAQTNATKDEASTNDKTVVGVWTIEGVVVTTEMEALKSQITEQEKQYNASYKGSVWNFKQDGTASVTYKKSDQMPQGGTGNARYEVKGDILYMEANGMPPEFTVSFEDGQMILTNKSALNTLYFVFIKTK